MKRKNIFDEITNNDDVSEEALCAIYGMLENLLHEFEMSAFYRIKCSFEDGNNKTRSKNNENSNNKVPPF